MEGGLIKEEEAVQLLGDALSLTVRSRSKPLIGRRKGLRKWGEGIARPLPGRRPSPQLAFHAT